MESCAEGVIKKDKNQSGPNLIFCPAGFEWTTGEGVGAASVLQHNVCVAFVQCCTTSAGCTNLIVFYSCACVYVHGLSAGCVRFVRLVSSRWLVLSSNLLSCNLSVGPLQHTLYGSRLAGPCSSDAPVNNCLAHLHSCTYPTYIAASVLQWDQILVCVCGLLDP